ncbi:MAG: S-methyl-5'-thioadenosine phosphorylase [Anaerolineales bacterium]|nr:S-methyl-5'-thioadenosine phosphorylase [Anaerolineales bacterium]
MPEATIGVIGGSGLYKVEGLSDIEQKSVKTPFGYPSDTITIGTLAGQRVAFLPRHGRGHRILPSELPFRANIYALKSLGIEHIISVSAVGSLREHLEPLHVVIPDQLFDRTKTRIATFFGEGLAVHISFDPPFCPTCSEALFKAAQAAGATAHQGGTYICMEGPQFSTLAESRVYRQWGMDIIGMTALPEAKLAREAEMSYAMIATVTDYDVWHDTEESVTAEAIIEVLRQNVEMSKEIIKAAVPRIAKLGPSPWKGSLRNAMVTAPDRIPQETREKLDLLVGQYLK